MVVLKKIKGSTLMETLVATVLIVIVFMIASLILNNVFSNHIRSQHHNLNIHFNELKYQYISNKITLPYLNTYDNWDITFEYIKTEDDYLAFKATNKQTLKTVEYFSYETQE